MGFDLNGIFERISTLWRQGGFSLAQAVCILSVIVGLICFLRRFRLSRKSLFSAHNLKILESKSLGNRQFLLVVSYESEKFLLGVYPNGMRFLSKLGSDKDIAAKKEPSHPSVPSL